MSRDPLSLANLAKPEVGDLDFSDPGVIEFFVDSCSDMDWTASTTGIRVHPTGPDPMLTGIWIPADLDRCRLVMVTGDFLGQSGCALKLYYTTDPCGGFDETRSQEVRVPFGEGPQTLAFDFSNDISWQGDGVELRIDLERLDHIGGPIELQRLRLLSCPSLLLDVVPPVPSPVSNRDFHLGVNLRGTRCGISSVTTSERLTVIEAPHPQRLESASAGGAALKLRAHSSGIHEVAIEGRGGLGRVGLELFIRSDGESDPTSAGVDLDRGLVMIRAPFDNRQICLSVDPFFAVSVCADGCVTRRVLPLMDVDRRADGICLCGERRMDGGVVRGEFWLGRFDEGRMEWRVTMEGLGSLQLTDLMLPRFLLGNPELGTMKDLSILPGVELLVGGQLPTEAARLPEPEKLTRPYAYLEQNGLAIAVDWEDSTLWPRFSAPDGTAGAAVHTLELHLPRRRAGCSTGYPTQGTERPYEVNGHVRVAPVGNRRLLLQLAGSHPEKLPETDARAVVLSSAVGLTTTFRGNRGLTRPNLAAADDHEFFDPRAFVGLLFAGTLGDNDFAETAAVQMAQFHRSKGGERIPLAAAILMPRGLEQLDREGSSYRPIADPRIKARFLELAVDDLADRAARLIAIQRSDGRWPPHIPPGCLAADPEAFARSAFAVARPTRQLLEACCLGVCDGSAARKALDLLLDPHLAPTGGQWWEFSPSVVDLLAVAELAEVWRLAAVSGVDVSGLEEGLKWLALGLAFLHLDSHAAATDPINGVACIPAFGITRDDAQGLLWYLHAAADRLDWRGISCPWVGLRFAEVLQRWRGTLEAIGGGVEAHVPMFERVTRLLLAHAAAVQRPDGSIPDGYRRMERQAQGPYRAPVELISVAVGQLGGAPSPAVAVSDSARIIGVGRFHRSGDVLEFSPTIPQSQALLVAGDITVSQGDRGLEVIPLRDGLSWYEISGRHVVRLG